MPPATSENAAMSIPENRGQREYEGSVPMAKKALSTKAPPPDDDTVSFRKQTRTWNYMWRSGVAGGLAGCAVRRVFLYSSPLALSAIDLLTSLPCTGENNRSASRPGQDPLPSEQSAVCEVLRIVGWRRRHAQGYILP